MAPPLALTLCIIFVLFLLRLEHKQSPNMSHALWIPTIWMLLIASKPLGIWFGSEGGTIETGSPIDRAFLGGLFCLGLLILAKRKFNWRIAIKENLWLMLLIGYMLVSSLWSEIPFISFKRWIRELVAVIMAFLILTERDPKEAMQSFFRRTIYILIPFSVLLIKYFPGYGVDYGRWSGGLTWIGVTLHKNSLGRLCLIAAFFLVWTLVRRWQGRDMHAVKYQTHVEVFVLIMTLWLLKGPPGAYSATALASLAVGLVAFVGFLWMKKHRIELAVNTLTLIMALVIGFGIVTLFVGGSTLTSFTSILGREETLTGRTDVWAELLPIVMQRPIVGYGFGGFWTTMNREVYNISEGHSGYLDVLLDLGLLGLLLFSIFLLACCRKAQRALIHDFDWGSLWICYLLMTVVHNITETSLNSFSTHLMAVILFLAVSSTAAASSTQRELHKKCDISQDSIS